MRMHLLLLIFLFQFIYCDIISIPSNCIGLSDGYYYFKLLEDDNYPIIYAKCSNEYLILDPSLDPDIEFYFNSFEMYHISVAGPSNEYSIKRRRNFKICFNVNTCTPQNTHIIEELKFNYQNDNQLRKVVNKELQLLKQQISLPSELNITFKSYAFILYIHPINNK